MLRSIKTIQGSVTIWVRSDEESASEFIYRFISTDGTVPQCYEPTSHQDDRSNWTITDFSAVALRECDEPNDLLDAGTLYQLQRAR